ncbi:MAG: hypothetical protein KDB97_05870 [Flavobacteriales bacterium]|nr:hypothetical protein [Flavobacteriales bacterium]
MRRRTLLLLPSTLFFADIFAQGCSDAGVCTAGPLGEALLTDSAYRSAAHIGLSFAQGEQGVNVFQVVPEVQVGLTHRLGAQLKLAYTTVNGDLGSTSGLGDITLSLTYLVHRTDRGSWQVLAGTRFPTNKADATVDDGPLPMPYQTSLGTWDLLFGVAYRNKGFEAALAYQYIYFDQNENFFLRSRWDTASVAQNYFNSFWLERGDDAILRLQYGFRTGRFDISPGLLGIYKVERARIIDEATYHWKEVEGSDGLTLNLTAQVRYNLSDRWAADLIYGSPLITRDVRPDGLTRSYVATLGLRWRF